MKATNWARAVELLVTRGLTLATVESLTGGGLGAGVTSVPGSSATYRGGAITYATDTKVSVTGVPQEVLDEHGVVSQECATAMASGGQRIFGADVGLSTTGVAGPDPLDGHPAGTVWVGIAVGDDVRAVYLSLEGDRESVRAQTMDAAVSELIATLDREQPRFG